MYIFKFKVKCYNADNKYYFTNSGLGLTENVGHAASQLENYFGDEFVSILDLEILKNENLIFLPEQTVEEYANCMFPAVEYETKLGDVKAAHWIQKKHDNIENGFAEPGYYTLWHCSECDDGSVSMHSFCRECGARMSGIPQYLEEEEVI